MLSKLEINFDPEGFGEIHEVLFVTQVSHLSVRQSKRFVHT